MKTIFFILCVLFGLMFINAGLNKFLNYMPPPENMPEALMRDFQAMMEISWLMPLIGIAEITGGLLVIIPGTRALGALVILPVMVGILLVNFLVDTSGLPIVLPLAAILAWIFYEYRHKYRQIIT